MVGSCWRAFRVHRVGCGLWGCRCGKCGCWMRRGAPSHAIDRARCSGLSGRGSEAAGACFASWTDSDVRTHDFQRSSLCISSREASSSVRAEIPVASGSGRQTVGNLVSWLEDRGGVMASVTSRNRSGPSGPLYRSAAQSMQCRRWWCWCFPSTAVWVWDAEHECPLCQIAS